MAWAWRVHMNHLVLLISVQRIISQTSFFLGASFPVTEADSLSPYPSPRAASSPRTSHVLQQPFTTPLGQAFVFHPVSQDGPVLAAGLAFRLKTAVEVGSAVRACASRCSIPKLLWKAGANETFYKVPQHKWGWRTSFWDQRENLQGQNLCRVFPLCSARGLPLSLTLHWQPSTPPMSFSLSLRQGQ